MTAIQNSGKHQSSLELIESVLLPRHSSPLQGGSTVRIFHKDVEAYLVAEGMYGEPISEEGQFLQRLGYVNIQCCVIITTRKGTITQISTF